MSRVDVVIPCYNYGKFLGDCVAGALDDQPGTDVRVLIIDDASQDDSAEIAHKLAAADDRVEVIVHPVNRGHIATFNEGLLDWADGDYCVLISADDRLAPGALRRAADIMDAHPEVGFVYGNVVEFRGGEEPPPARTKSRGQTIWPGHWWLEQRFREANTCIFSPEVVVRTSVQHHVGGYNPDLLPHVRRRDVDAAGGLLRRGLHPRRSSLLPQARREHVTGAQKPAGPTKPAAGRLRRRTPTVRRRAAQCGRTIRHRAQATGRGGSVERHPCLRPSVVRTGCRWTGWSSSRSTAGQALPSWVSTAACSCGGGSGPPSCRTSSRSSGPLSCVM